MARTKTIQQFASAVILHPTTDMAPPDSNEPSSIIKIKDHPIAFEEREIPTRLIANMAPSPISAQLGFPIKLAKIFELSGNRSGSYNYYADMFFIVGDATDHNFGNNPSEEYLGDVAIVRTDGKAIHRKQVKVLVDYLFDEVSTPLLDQPAVISKKVKKAIEQKLTPEAFHAYFEEYKRKRIKAGGANG